MSKSLLLKIYLNFSISDISGKEGITNDKLSKRSTLYGYTTSIKYMFIVLFVLLFYIVHCCIDIEDRSLSGLYFNKIILSYLEKCYYDTGIIKQQFISTHLL
jgi:hypothetical protein